MKDETLKRIEALEAEIKKLKDELSKPVLPVAGNWYKVGINLLICIKKLNGDSAEVYGFSPDGFYESGDFCVINGMHPLVSATESEVFEALKKEAINRGFKEGVEFDRGEIGIFGWTGKAKAYTNRFEYAMSRNVLYIDSRAIFHNGKWAEIIKDEPLKICGYEVKKEDDDYKIVCKTIHRADVSHLKYLMNSLDVKSAQLGEYKVTLEEINKLLEL